MRSSIPSGNPSWLNIKDFTKLYKEVTEELTAFVEKALNTNNPAYKITESEAIWFSTLIERFYFKFSTSWSSDAKLRPYLDRFNNVNPILRLASHAFLHIAYDLPWITALSFEWKGRFMQQPKYPNTTYIKPSQNRLRTIFLRPAPLFRRAFLTYSLKGGFGFMGKLIGLFEPAEILAYWVISLRTVAFIQAEILSETPSSERELLKSKLLKGIEDASEKVLATNWIKLLRVPKFDNATFFQFLPPALLLNSTVIMAGLLSVAVITFFRIRRMILVNRINYFGYLVHKNLIKVSTPINGDDNQNRNDNV